MSHKYIKLVRYSTCLCRKYKLYNITGEDLFHDVYACALRNNRKPGRWSYYFWHKKLTYACLDEHKKQAKEAEFKAMLNQLVQDRKYPDEDN